ncbi:MAG: acetyl-CoA carboxylase biotin carboxyl carrier protein subunit [Bacteroidetes bacterium]|nr:acetyl-CoA carboxylase biotin carboxyl carrier protein subunit [Bacteroidota bacterium]
MQSEKYIATVNDKEEFELTDAIASSLDVVSTGNGQFHVLRNGKSFLAEIVSVDKQTKEVRMKLNGKLQTVQLQDKYDQLVNKMGLSANIVHKISAIKAPMPGLVLSILVEPGQEVSQGTPMLILEAMKMENVIKSPGEGTVKRIVVETGKPVDKGETLIEMK